MEEIFLHIDMSTRRTAPWPADVAANLDRQIAADANCLRLPLAGCLTLRYLARVLQMSAAIGTFGG